MNVAESWQVVDRLRIAVADLLAELEPTESEAPSWCIGWTVKDVGAHLALAASTPTREVLGYLVQSRGQFDTMIDLASRDRSAQRTTQQVIDDLRGLVGSRRLAPMTFWRDPLLDVLVHSQDLSRPIGRTLELPVEASREAAEWAWRRWFPFFPARRLAGVRLIADDIEWQRGTGDIVSGSIADLLLLATGRRAVLQDLTGPGVAVLQRRFSAPARSDSAN